MSTVLAQLAVAIGGIVFILAVVLAMVNGVPLLSAVLRAIAVMCFASMFAAIFFRFFTNILYKFVAQRMVDQVRDELQNQEETKKKQASLPGVQKKTT